MAFNIFAQQVFVTEDGQKFDTAEEAQAHQFALENDAELTAIVENHCNDLKLIDRSRALRAGAAKEFMAWYMQWDANGRPTIERTVFDSEPAPRKKKGEGDAEAPAEEEAPVADAFA